MVGRWSLIKLIKLIKGIKNSSILLITNGYIWREMSGERFFQVNLLG